MSAIGRRSSSCLAGIPAERPLTAVFHAAGTLDDGVITSLDADRLRRVMAPKLDAAIHLHELTRDLDLSEFVLFSSAAGTLGTPGQGNYASANTFLDALAQRRRADGRPAMSLAFGLWERGTGMTSHLTEPDGMRSGPLDMLPMPDELGLELIDVARAVDQPLLVPMRLDLGALQARAATGVLPRILSDLVRARSRPSAAAGSSLAKVVASAPEAERDRIVIEFVRTHAAAVLGHASPQSVEPDRPFRELGIDSLSAVELRNRLAKASGTTLPATLAFDYPTSASVAKLLRDTIDGRERDGDAHRREVPGLAGSGENGDSAMTVQALAREDGPVGPRDGAVRLRDGARRPRQAVRRAAVIAHSSTWTRRLVPAPVALAGIRLYAAGAQRGRTPTWREQVDYYEQLLRYTPLRGTEEAVARRAISELFSCLEIFWRPWVMASGEIVGLQRLQHAQAQKRGVVLAFSHFGPSYALFPISARHDLGLSVISSPHHYEDLGTGYDARFARRGRAYLDLLGEGRSISRAGDAGRTESALTIGESRLRAGEVVAIAFDVVGGLRTPFLGRTVRLTRGPAWLARSTGAIIVPVVVRRWGTIPVVEVGQPIEAEQLGDEATIQEALARQMEAWALELPEAVWPLHQQPGGAPLIQGPPIDTAED